jgi:hypothetical protein
MSGCTAARVAAKNFKRLNKNHAITPPDVVALTPLTPVNSSAHKSVDTHVSLVPMMITSQSCDV